MWWWVREREWWRDGLKKPGSASITSSRVSQPYFLHQHNGAGQKHWWCSCDPRLPDWKQGMQYIEAPGLKILMGHQVRRRDVIGGILGRHPRYRGILGWHGQDIGAGAVGCLWYPIVSTEGPGSTRPRLISAFQGLGITRSPSRWHLSQALVNLIMNSFPNWWFKFSDLIMKW